MCNTQLQVEHDKYSDVDELLDVFSRWNTFIATSYPRILDLDIVGTILYFLEILNFLFKSTETPLFLGVKGIDREILPKFQAPASVLGVYCNVLQFLIQRVLCCNIYGIILCC